MCHKGKVLPWRRPDVFGTNATKTFGRLKLIVTLLGTVEIFHKRLFHKRTRIFRTIAFDRTLINRRQLIIDN